MTWTRKTEPSEAFLSNEHPTVVHASDVALHWIFVAMVAIGVAVGLLFPHLVTPFVEVRQGQDLWFRIACLMSGVFVGCAACGVADLTLHRTNRYLAHLAAYDALTGLPNQRHFLRLLSSEMMRSERMGEPVSLIMIDVDHFKRVNDTHGHLVGNRVLMSVADDISRSARAYDDACRVGGEEFAVILPHTEPADALSVAERMRSNVALIAHEGQPGVTISAGVATFPTDGDTIRVLIGRADEALYAAKREGRNCVRAWAASGDAAPGDAAPRDAAPGDAAPEGA